MEGRPMPSGFMRHIDRCNRHDMAGFHPFRVEGQRVGWVRPAFRDRLLTFPEVFQTDDDALVLSSSLDQTDQRTEAVGAVLERLVVDGAIPRLRQEMYGVQTAWGAAPLLAMDRAAIPFFGITAYGLHINGFVRRGDGIHLWVATRARDRGVAPGQFDNMVAGGQPLGLSLRDNLVKEAREEADLPPDLALQAQPVGAITYRMEQKKGLKPDVLFVYDLELPDGFIPRNTDGEVERFDLWPLEKVAASVAQTDDWKFNVNLVVIDFLIRHGWLGPEHPEYLDLCRNLHR
jgi:8-oxo-dGTP pyrophosphatase MutT (NUDIX family)